MKNFLDEKPWYFALCVFGFILQPLLEWLVMYFFDEELVRSWLESSVTISSLIPWLLCILIFVVCTIVYIIQQVKRKQRVVSVDELSSLNSILLSTVNDNEYIESMQAFQYKIANGQSEKYIKLDYLAGVADERIEINTILQTYFYFTYPNYKKISIISNRYSRYINETDPIKKDDYRTEFLSAGNELCTYFLETLNNIENESDITEFHCDMYRVLAKLLPAISDQAIESFLEKDNIEISLIKRKKTGILGAIVINDLYIFRNQNSLSKSDRIYFAFQYNAQKNIVFLGSINTSCFVSDSFDSIEVYCKDIVNKICSTHTS